MKTIVTTIILPLLITSPFLVEFLTYSEIKRYKLTLIDVIKGRKIFLNKKNKLS
ncbi:MAG: hypothetical protein Q4F97_00195 [Bacteroidales bacterium]|nr:hypothetical protein [Bacteroidales bacterium]